MVFGSRDEKQFKSNLTLYSENTEKSSWRTFTLNINLSSFWEFPNYFCLFFSHFFCCFNKRFTVKSESGVNDSSNFPTFDVYRCFRKHTFLVPAKPQRSSAGRIRFWRFISSIFITSRRCDHMMILWWWYEDHMMMNDHHMMLVCQFRGDTARNWGRFLSGILGTGIHLSWVP